VINISSISGGLVFPFVGAYGATKHAVEALSDGLRRELSIYDIDVIAIEPGNIRTPIWDKAATVDPRYTATDYAPILSKLPAILAEMVRKGDPVERVSAAIHRAVAARRPKTRYPLTFLWRLSRVLGDRTLDRLTLKGMGFK
jgi:NAD(P)-dependent dehydrogenase (short-subunit alcohol dehydrogenase family)